LRHFNATGKTWATDGKEHVRLGPGEKAAYSTSYNTTDEIQAEGEDERIRLGAASKRNKEKNV